MVGAAPSAGRDRLDLRDLETLTIDPEGAKDHDDALSIDGDRVYVHIADVAAHVPAGSGLDAEAARRGTSVYLPGRVDPMLPAELSADRCSLRAGADRLAVSLALGPGREVTAHRTLIRSDHSLTYPQAQAILDGAPAPGPLAAAVRRTCRAGGRSAQPPDGPRGARDRDARDRDLDRGGHARRPRPGAYAGARPDRGADDPRQPQGRRAHRRGRAAGPPSRARAARCELDRGPARAARGARRADAARAGPAWRPRDRPVCRPPEPRRHAVRRPGGERRRGLARDGAAVGAKGPLRPLAARAQRDRGPPLLPFHVADPPLSRPGLPPRAPGRARAR